MAETIDLGIVGIKNMGVYDSQTQYEKLNVVTYQGSTYCALKDTLGNLPTDTDYWQLYAEKGSVGPEGPQGPKPVKGVDYYTTTDIAEIESDLADDISAAVSESVGSLASATPLAASSVADMTDTTRIYVNTTDGHWYWYNGSAWTDGGVYQSTGIDDNSILPEHTTFLENITNSLFDKRKYLKGFYDASGIFHLNDTYYSTDKIYVNDYTKLKSNITGYVCFFNESNQFISSLINNSNGGVFDIPENTAYLYGAFDKKLLNKIYIIPYNEYYHNYYDLQNDIKIDNSNLKKNSVSYLNTDFFELNYKDHSNMCDNTSLTSNKGLNEDGTLYDVNNYSTSDFIKVKENQALAINNHGARVSIYDKDKHCITSFINVNIPSNRYEITLPKDSMFIRVMTYNSYLPLIVCDSEYQFTEIFGYNPYIEMEKTLEDTIKSLVSDEPTNLKINCLGDSITVGMNNNNVSYANILANKYTTVRKYGVSATTIAKQENKNNSFLERYSTMDSDADIITVMGGTNDFALNVPLGTFNNNDDYTFYGALKSLILGLIEKYPTKKIMFITELKRTYDTNGISINYDDYLNAIKEVCSYYAIPILDLASEMGFNVKTNFQYENYIPDKLHPNTNGHTIIANKIDKFIQYKL